MLHLGRRIVDLDVGKGVGAALVADQERVALRVIACVIRFPEDLDHAAVAVLSVPGGDALGDDRRLGVLADVDHLGAGVGLLVVVGHGHRVELADRVVSLQDAARILPGDRRSGLDLSPGDLRVLPQALTAFGHEVVDAALAVLVSGIPVLHRRVLDLGVVERDELDHRGVELVLVADRGSATFKIRDVGALVGDDQGSLELAGVGGVDAEVRRELHGAAHTLGDVAERAVGEDRGVQGGEEVVAVRNDRAQVLLDQLRMVQDRLGERAEDDADLGELLAEGRGHGDRVEHRVDGDAGELPALAQRNPQFLVSLQKLRVDVLERLRRVLLRLGRRVIDDRLVVDGRVADVGPGRLLHRRPEAVGAQPPLEHPLRLVLLGREDANDVFIQTSRNRLRLDVRDEAGLVLAVGELQDRRVGGCWVGCLLAHQDPSILNLYFIVNILSSA